MRWEVGPKSMHLGAICMWCGQHPKKNTNKAGAFYFSRQEWHVF